MSLLRWTKAYRNQLSYTKPESILPLGVSDSINSTNRVSDSINSIDSPSISNKFEILSQLDEELND